MRPSSSPLRLTFVFGLSAFACTTDDGEALEHQLVDAREETDALRVQADTHHGDALAAADLSELRAIEDAYGPGGDASLDDLDHMFGDMHMCGIDDDDMIDHMQDVRDQCAGDLDRHRDGIATATDLEAAIAEENRHHDAMTAWFDELDATLDDLADSDAETMCHGHHGMHDHHGS